SDMMWTCLVSGHGVGFQHELGIPEGAHLRDVEPFELHLRGYAVAPERLDEHVEHETEAEDEADERRDANQLRDELPRIAVEQTGDRPRHAVPGAGVVALAVGKQSY